RKLVAAPYLAPNDWTPRSEAYFVFPLAQGTPGKQCGLAATRVYQPSLRSPWLAAGVNFVSFLTCVRFCISCRLVPRRYDELLHAIECLPVLEPEVIFRPIQAVVFRAVDIPASRYITSDCGAYIDSPEIPSVFSYLS
uniref:hypothetical protein n=2 Tax=Thiolapillus sp. TaxID=2017437 RepID=UPI0027395ED8